MGGGPDGFEFCFVGVVVVVVDIAAVIVVRAAAIIVVIDAVVCFGIVCLGQTIRLERGPKTVRVHRVDAAGAREVDAVG